VTATAPRISTPPTTLLTSHHALLSGHHKKIELCKTAYFFIRINATEVPYRNNHGKEKQMRRLEKAEMRFFRAAAGYRMTDHKSNEHIRELGITYIITTIQYIIRNV
jgi:hypothetical protein